MVIYNLLSSDTIIRIVTFVAFFPFLIFVFGHVYIKQIHTNTRTEWHAIIDEEGTS